MPHLTLEYSGNLPVSAKVLLLNMNAALAASAHFKEIDIKSRAVRFDEFAVGTADGRAFVHAKLAILQGRTAEIKRQLSETLLVALQSAGNWPAGLDIQLCAEIQELESASYAKAHFQS